ncbi:MAG: DUF2971 domain-containing protein [Nitrospinae bacterium]|nr:DUF2971 domain-containing protein [Nitrospinota bacterium]
MNNEEKALKIQKIFFPTWLKRKKQIKDDSNRIVHYTSAEAGLSIIENREIWMREKSAMNDYSEAKYGEILLYKSPSREIFVNALNGVFPKAIEKIDHHLGITLNQADIGVYISCFSEHKDSEDLNGRLSMWRAYGGDTGVAIVFNNKHFVNPEAKVGIYTSPVEYLDQKQYDNKLNEMTSNIVEETEFLRSFGNEEFSLIVSQALLFSILCIKHPGFSEELEWRVLSVPTIHNVEDFLIPHVACIKGTPQTIYKIPLKNREDLNLKNLEVSEFVDRVIIGPSENPKLIKQVFVKSLKTVGFKDPEKRVFISDIPLRSK